MTMFIKINFLSDKMIVKIKTHKKLIKINLISRKLLFGHQVTLSKKHSNNPRVNYFALYSIYYQVKDNYTPWSTKAITKKTNVKT